MKTIRKFLAIIIVICMAAALFAGCGNNTSNSGSAAGTGSGTTQSGNTATSPSAKPDSGASNLDLGPYTPENPLVLKFGHYGTGDIHPSNILANLMKEKLETRSNGAIKVEIFGDGILGFDVALFESVMSGTVDFAPNNPFMMAAYQPALEVLDIHYLFDDLDHVKKYIGSDVYNKINKLCEDLNVIILGQQWLGFRVTSTRTTPIRKAEDIKGLRLRMSTSDLFVKYFSAYGAVPISMAPDEFVPALQQGVVDGTDLPTAIQWQSNYHQYQKVFSSTNHLAQWNMLNMNKDKFNSYTPDLQELLKTAAHESCVESFDIMNKANEDAVALLQKDGVTIVDDVDVNAFKEIAKKVTDAWLATHDRTLYDEIRALAD